ncbi:MAG: hypothetical protein ACYS5W_04085 [Planctomycetota bacterium]|jgi:hypothetical protein
MKTGWKVALLVTLGAVLGAGVALIVNIGPHTAKAADTCDGLAIGLLLGIAIGSSLRWQRGRQRRKAA